MSNSVCVCAPALVLIPAGLIPWALVRVQCQHDSPYVSVTASVSSVPSVTDTFQLNVPLDGLATPADQTSTEGATVTLGVVSTQSSGQTFVAAGLPAGLSINSSTGAITGTIAAGSAAVILLTWA